MRAGDPSLPGACPCLASALPLVQPLAQGCPLRQPEQAAEARPVDSCPGLNQQQLTQTAVQRLESYRACSRRRLWQVSDFSLFDHCAHDRGRSRAPCTCKAARSSVLVVSDHIRPAWLWSRNRAVQKASQLLFRSAAACASCHQELRGF